FHVGQVVGGVVQSVDVGTELSTQRADIAQGSVDGVDHRVGVTGGGDLGARRGRGGVGGGQTGQGGTQGGGLRGGIQLQGFGSGGAVLEGHGACAELAGSTVGAEQGFASVAGVGHDVGQLFAQLVVFGLQ